MDKETATQMFVTQVFMVANKFDKMFAFWNGESLDFDFILAKHITKIPGHVRGIFPITSVNCATVAKRDVISD